MRSIYLSASRARGTADKERLLSLLSKHFVVREFNEDKKQSPLDEKDHDLAFTVILPYRSDDYESDGVVTTGKGGYSDIVSCISTSIPIYVAVNYYHHGKQNWIFVSVNELDNVNIINENDWKEEFCEVYIMFCESLHIETLTYIYTADDTFKWVEKGRTENNKEDAFSLDKRLLLLGRK